MDPQTVAQAFEPFFTTKPVGKGTGLGLSQVYGFVKQSGGHVKIYSEPGQGTTVKLYLPRLAGEAVPNRNSTSPSIRKPVRKKRRSSSRMTRTSEPIPSKVCGSLAIASWRRATDLLPYGFSIRQSRVDLLFTDVVLPNGMTGAQLAAQARTIRPSLKVLFTTGYARNAIIHHGRLDKGVHLIVKPFSFTDLAAKVRDVLDKIDD